MNEAAEAITDEILPPVELLGTLNADAQLYRKEQLKHVISDDADELKEIEGDLTLSEGLIAGYFSKLRTSSTTTKSARWSRSPTSCRPAWTHPRPRSSPAARVTRRPPAGSCSTPVNEIGAAADRIAAGDLTVSIDRSPSVTRSAGPWRR